MSVMGVSCSCFSSCVALGGALEVEKLSSSSAQFFIIMKKILLLLVAILSATMSFAQNSLVATLTHGDEVQMFYGSFALQKAHQAAVDGDVINLSGGSFQSTTITKAVSVRGVGIDDEIPTYITGNFTINIPEEVTERLSFEGCRIASIMTVNGTLKNAYFFKDYVSQLNVSSSNANIVNGMFANCKLYGMDLYGNSSVQFVNSYVSEFCNYAKSIASANFVNCVIQPYSNNYAEYISSSQLVNCIIYYTSSSNFSNYGIPNTSSAVNCVAVGNSYAFSYMKNNLNCKIASDAIFQNSSDITKDLTDEAKAKYLGTDGTPVGMYGGVLPYNSTPSYPRITKLNVASKATTDGKLNVEIEISDPE